jgi:LysM repeat protein
MKTQIIWLVLVMWLSACIPANQTPVVTKTATLPGELTPYLTATAPVVVTPGKTAAAKPLPSPSATLRTHTIKKGETVSGIALLYGVTIDAILAANPKLNPNMLVVGSTLVVPASQGTQASGGDLTTATPLPLRLDGVHCAAVQDGGAWCFVLAHNPQKNGVESVSVVIRIADENGQGMQSQVAYAMLNLLLGKGTLPLAVYFQAPVPKTIQASAELLTALPVNTADKRYLVASLSGVKTNIQLDGLSAIVKGTVSLDKSSARAQQVWVLLTAYDASGQVIGLRRWEMDAKQVLKPGKTLAFAQTVYSTGGTIEKVDVMVEARP